MSFDQAACTHSCRLVITSVSFLPVETDGVGLAKALLTCCMSAAPSSAWVARLAVRLRGLTVRSWSFSCRSGKVLARCQVRSRAAVAASMLAAMTLSSRRLTLGLLALRRLFLPATATVAFRAVGARAYKLALLVATN